MRRGKESHLHRSSIKDHAARGSNIRPIAAGRSDHRTSSKNPCLSMESDGLQAAEVLRGIGRGSWATSRKHGIGVLGFMGGY